MPVLGVVCRRGRPEVARRGRMMLAGFLPRGSRTVESFASSTSSRGGLGTEIWVFGCRLCLAGACCDLWRLMWYGGPRMT